MDLFFSNLYISPSDGPPTGNLDFGMYAQQDLINHWNMSILPFFRDRYGDRLLRATLNEHRTQGFWILFILDRDDGLLGQSSLKFFPARCEASFHAQLAIFLRLTATAREEFPRRIQVDFSRLLFYFGGNYLKQDAEVCIVRKARKFPDHPPRLIEKYQQVMSLMHHCNIAHGNLCLPFVFTVARRNELLFEQDFCVKVFFRRLDEAILTEEGENNPIFVWKRDEDRRRVEPFFTALQLVPL